MSDTITISFDLGATDTTAGLNFEVQINNKILYNNIVDFDFTNLKFELSDNEADHELCFIMQNKTIDHTKINESGIIISDAKLLLKNLAFGGIELDHLLTEQAVYTHDFNGTGSKTQDKFYGEIGCNGTISLKFSTPVHIWLLENL
jgi:hypothetical protein